MEDRRPTEFDSHLLLAEVHGLAGETREVQVTDGFLEVELLHGPAENPCLAGIEIERRSQN